MSAVHDTLNEPEHTAVQLSNSRCLFVLIDKTLALKHVSETLEVTFADHLLEHQTNQLSLIGNLDLHDVVLGLQELDGLVNCSGAGRRAFDELKMLKVSDPQFLLRILVLLVNFQVKRDELSIDI